MAIVRNSFQAHLLSKEYNHRAYAKGTELTYVLLGLDDRLFFVRIVTFLKR